MKPGSRDGRIVYVALLRGINVGGKNMLSMKSLAASFERAGFQDVTTYINSGNVLFRARGARDPRRIERKIDRMLHARVRPSDQDCVVRSHAEMARLVKTISATWKPDARWRHNVIFPRHPIDSKDVLVGLDFKPDLERVVYCPGTLLWSARIDALTRSAMLKLAGKPLYREMTVRKREHHHEEFSPSWTKCRTGSAVRSSPVVPAKSAHPADLNGGRNCPRAFSRNRRARTSSKSSRRCYDAHRAMASIMCAQALWRAVRPPKWRGAAERGDEPVFQGVQFGPWAATLARFDGHDLVIAMDAATYLTLVFRFQAPTKFRSNFVAALRDALEDFQRAAVHRGRRKRGHRGRAARAVDRSHAAGGVERHEALLRRGARPPRRSAPRAAPPERSCRACTAIRACRPRPSRCGSTAPPPAPRRARIDSPGCTRSESSVAPPFRAAAISTLRASQEQQHMPSASARPSVRRQLASVRRRGSRRRQRVGVSSQRAARPRPRTASPSVR